MNLLWRSLPLAIRRVAIPWWWRGRTVDSVLSRRLIALR
jgi:hypothetical protein